MPPKKKQENQVVCIRKEQNRNNSIGQTEKNNIKKERKKNEWKKERKRK